jgi:hypothetical protein
VTAYDASEWNSLFIATTGAAAALTGLVFVAVSINLEQILKQEGLPDRALETVLLLLSVLFVSIVALVPGQGHIPLGVELLTVGTIFGVGIGLLARKSLPHGPRRAWVVGRVIVVLVATVPTLIGGISLLAMKGGGFYWIVAGILGAIGGGIVNAWVLLIEILR